MIEFVSCDPQKLLEEIVSSVEKELEQSLYPGDERILFIKQLLLVLVGMKAEINDTGNQNLLRYARGDCLDELGYLFDVARIPAKKATCSLVYSVGDKPLSFDILIPAGSRATPDGTLLFRTMMDGIVFAGSLQTELTAEAEEPGEAYNGFLPGQISNMVDIPPFVLSVVNGKASFGGADIEGDDSYRGRIRESYRQYSTAGSKESYRYWARTVSTSIADVAVTSPEAGEVAVFVLDRDTVTPARELLEQVQAVLSADKHRPMNDLVTVSGPSIVEYTILATYFIQAKNAADVTGICIAASAAAAEFSLSVSSTMGGAVNPDQLRALLYQAGVYRVDITEPSYTALQVSEVGVCGQIQLTYGGLL